MRVALGLAFSVLAALALPSTAMASDEATELWLNPSVTHALDGQTELEIETAQRFREAPRDDTYFVRMWFNRKAENGAKWSLGAEQRWNGPDQEEVRLLQQVGYGWRALEFRTRMEQRFVSTDPNTGWRLRQRIGTTVPLSEDDDGWSLAADAELIMTLASTSENGQTGLTGVRTFVGFERGFGRYDISLGYLRQQDIRERRPDRIGHAPFVGFNVDF